MAQRQDNMIGGIILLAVAVLVYELYKNGTLAKWIGFAGTTSSTASSSASSVPSAGSSAKATAGTSGYTGTGKSTTTTTSGGTVYTVQKGDNLSVIAQKYGVSLAALEAANPQITNPNLIYPGQHVSIPTGTGISSAGTSSSSYSGATVYSQGHATVYPQPVSVTVQKGNTLWGIAQSHGLSLQQVEQLNPQIKNPNLIYPGEEVFI